jgi:hypothetical protein
MCKLITYICRHLSFGEGNTIHTVVVENLLAYHSMQKSTPKIKLSLPAQYS